MRYIMFFLVGFIPAFALGQLSLNAKEVPKAETKDELVCVTNKELDNLMVEKGYDILLQMTNPDGVVESVWT